MKVLILGSAPDALRAREWRANTFDAIVAVNNAWQVRDDWTYSIFPSDFPDNKRALAGAGQKLISADEYVDTQNAYGGFVYAGGTMAFTTAYWVLAALKPSIIAFMGCDMVYTATNTHFYGKGKPDPLREDVTLRSLEAKSARFEALAAEQNCKVVNLSEQPESRLLFPRNRLDDVLQPAQIKLRNFNMTQVNTAKQREADLGYFVENGKYWKHVENFDPAEIDKLDKLWLSTLEHTQG